MCKLALAFQKSKFAYIREFSYFIIACIFVLIQLFAHETQTSLFHFIWLKTAP